MSSKSPSIHAGGMAVISRWLREPKRPQQPVRIEKPTASRRDASIAALEVPVLLRSLTGSFHREPLTGGIARSSLNHRRMAAMPPAWIEVMRAFLLGVFVLTAWSAFSADIEITETLQLPECHSLDWVRTHTGVRENGPTSLILDEAKWGTPAPGQAISQHWDWDLSDAQWAEAVKQKGEGKKEDVKIDLWLPEGIGSVRGIVVITGHGSGETLYKHAELRRIARELRLAIFKFVGNPMQRGFWPRALLDQRLAAFAEKSKHPELNHAPLFLYGHSNGTGFSAIYPAIEGSRVWAWVSMRPGTTFQVYQPKAAQVPGMVIFGEDDGFFARPSKEQNMAVVESMRKKHNALWHYAVEPKTGHGPGEKTWPLVFSFLRYSFAARVPADADPTKGAVQLTTIKADSGHLGQNWNATTGGYQTLPIASFAEFPADKSTASWLLNAAFATDWQTFQRDGQLTPKAK